MKSEFQFNSRDKKTKIHVVKWTPDTGNIRAILQISHGMQEYIERYEDFALFLNEQDILVVGNDHLGHGESVIDKGLWGYFSEIEASQTLVEDLHFLREMIQSEYPDIPYFLLGHSMGSFLVRRYMTYHEAGLAGVIIMGTGNHPNATLKVGMAFIQILAKLFGWKHRSRLVNQMIFGGNHKKFSKTDPGNNWLTKDAEIVKSYQSNPKCTFIFTLNGFYALFETILYINQENHLEKIKKEIPVFVVSGECDPVGNFGAGVKTVYKKLKEQDIMDLTWKLYSGDRHEILNELDREKVYQDIYSWMKIRI